MHSNRFCEMIHPPAVLAGDDQTNIETVRPKRFKRIQRNAVPLTRLKRSNHQKCWPFPFHGLNRSRVNGNIDKVCTVVPIADLYGARE